MERQAPHQDCETQQHMGVPKPKNKHIKSSRDHTNKNRKKKEIVQ